MRRTEHVDAHVADMSDLDTTVEEPDRGDRAGLVAIIAQAIIIASIWFVTGIPATEAQAVRSKGDAYRAYQARVSRFVPRPPKRS